MYRVSAYRNNNKLPVLFLATLSAICCCIDIIFNKRLGKPVKLAKLTASFL